MDKFIKEDSNLNCECIKQQSCKIQEAKTKELKGDLDESTIITGDLSAPFAITERTT